MQARARLYLCGCINELDPSVSNGQYDKRTLSRILGLLQLVHKKQVQSSIKRAEAGQENCRTVLLILIGIGLTHRERG